MNLVALLAQLQTIDQEFEEKTKRLALVDQSLASDPTLVTAQVTLAAEQKKLNDLKTTMRDRELQAKSLEDKIKASEQRLYSGTVINPKELDGLSKDLEMNKRQRSALDDKLLELMDAVEQALVRVNAQTETVKQIETKRADDLDNLKREQATLTKRLATLDADRAKNRSAMAADALRTYDHLKRTKLGRAVAMLKRDSCGACGVTVPTGLINRLHNSEEIVLCVGCGRILAN